jgi:hypothetical protein
MMTMMTKSSAIKDFRSDFYQPIVHLTLAPPPQRRLVVVQAWCDSEHDQPREGGHHFHEVLYVQAVVFRSYERSRKANEPCARPRSPLTVDLLRDGWHYEAFWENTVCYSPIIMGSDGYLGTASEIMEYDLFGAWRLVACPWPPEQDEQALAPVVQELVREDFLTVQRKAANR